MVLRYNNKKDLKNLIKLVACTNNSNSSEPDHSNLYLSKKRNLRFLQQNCLNVLFFLAERLKELERLVNNFFKEKDSTARRKYLIQIQRKLVKSQEYGDDKLQLVGNMIDLVRAVWHLYVWSGCLSKNSKQPTKHLLTFFFSCGRLIFALGRLKWTWKTLTQAGMRISLHSWNRKPSQVPTIITKINILFVYTLYAKFSCRCIKIVFVCLLLCLVILEEHHAKPTEKKRKLIYSLILT